MRVEIRKLLRYSFACNVGRLDRIVRLLVGIAMVLAGALVIDSFGVRIATAITGVAIAMTGVVSRCGIYYLTGVSTRARPAVGSDAI